MALTDLLYVCTGLLISCPLLPGYYQLSFRLLRVNERRAEKFRQHLAKIVFARPQNFAENRFLMEQFIVFLSPVVCNLSRKWHCPWWHKIQQWLLMYILWCNDHLVTWGGWCVNIVWIVLTWPDMAMNTGPAEARASPDQGLWWWWAGKIQSNVWACAELARPWHHTSLQCTTVITCLSQRSLGLSCWDQAWTAQADRDRGSHSDRCKQRTGGVVSS